jgi:two-component system, LytTR family, response regulator
MRVRTRHAASAGNGCAACSARSGWRRPTSPRRAAERIPIVEKGRISFVALDDVERIEGEGDYVRVHAGSRSHLVRQTLGALERRLDPTRFVPVHRSTIVRVACIAELQPYFHGEYVLITKSRARLKVSRTYRAALSRVLGAEL